MEDKDVIIRFGVSMQQSLVNQFDDMIGEQGYTNRSEAIRDLVRKALLTPNRLHAAEMVAGTISVVYDHHYSGLTSSLMELQHDYCEEIISTMHVHLNHQQCLEIIVVRGTLKTLHALCAQIQVQKGVFYAELSVTHVENAAHTHAHTHVHTGHAHE